MFVKARPKRPPGPSLYELLNEPWLDDWYTSLELPLKLVRRYGEIVYIAAGKQYIVAGASSFEHILKTNAKNYTKSNPFYKRISWVFGKSLLMTDFEEWRHKRKISQPVFQANMMKNYVGVINQETESLIKSFSGSGHSTSSKPQRLNIFNSMTQLTLNIALGLFCNQSLEPKQQRSLSRAIHFGNWYTSHHYWIHPYKPTISNLRFFRHQKNMNAILLGIIQERRAGRNRVADRTGDEAKADLLHLLLTAPHETEDRLLNDQEILDEFKTILLTGHETTSCALTWFWYILAKHPEYRECIEAELETVLNNRAPTLDDLHHLPFLKAALSESMRLYPPIWCISRTNIEDDVVCGYDIPKGSLLTLNLYALHRNRQYFNEPDRFYPERFIKPSHPPFAYLPFSAGPRTCIASHFGFIEAMLIAIQLLQTCRFSLTRKKPPTLEPCISLRPRGGLWMKQVRR